jgi:phosphosulfolactate synthase
MLEVAADYVDIVKFGWATSVIVQNLDAKLEAYRSNNIDVCCGGSLFELAVVKKQLPEYISFLKDHGFEHVEVSDGVIELSRATSSSTSSGSRGTSPCSPRSAARTARTSSRRRAG